MGARLLTTTDDIEARTIAVELDRLNRVRQQIEIEALAEAEAEALFALGLEERGAAVVVAGATWPPGIVGLLAARLKERFERPAFALSLAGGYATGSGRSIAGVDLGRAVRAAIEAGVAIKGGGHAMAAGVTLASERLGDWRAFLEERLGQAVTKARAEAGLKVDAALTANAATPELVHRLEAAGPYGAGAPEPLFALPRHRLAEVTPVGAERPSPAPARGRGRRAGGRGHRLPRLGQEARRSLDAPQRRAGASRRDPLGEPLRRPGAGADPGRRRRGGGAVTAYRTVRGVLRLKELVIARRPEADAAIQDEARRTAISGLLRRFAPRNDGPEEPRPQPTGESPANKRQ